MTERITIEGSDLTVTHDQAKSDPKRIRPPRFDPSPVPAEFRTVQQVIENGNPHWSDEANDWADAHPETVPLAAAQKWAGHQRKEDA